MILLAALLCICHFLADFSPLSTAWMLHAKSRGWPLFPIAVHAGIHATLMFAVLLCFVPFTLACQLAALQWLAHFIIDVGKGRMNVLFPAVADSTQKSYWMLFGFDQLLHQLVILGMVWGSINF